MTAHKPVVLFYRDFQQFSGGHLKVWDYFNHVLASDSYTARIAFSSASKWDASNPWLNSRDLLTDWDPEAADLLFLAGTDWRALGRLPVKTPIINLIQHPRHAEPGTEVRSYLCRAALRICVSQEVADAINATNEVNGPVFAIPNGIDLTPFQGQLVERRSEVLIFGMKSPDLARAVEGRLSDVGVKTRAVIDRMVRSDFLKLLPHGGIAVFIPRPSEGFYLPALEAMAAGAIVVCPDCVGNRSFCLDGVNCLRPAHAVDAIVAATRAALVQSEDERSNMVRAARATAEEHSLARERQQFFKILDRIDTLL